MKTGFVPPLADQLAFVLFRASFGKKIAAGGRVSVFYFLDKKGDNTLFVLSADSPDILIQSAGPAFHPLLHLFFIR